LAWISSLPAPKQRSFAPVLALQLPLPARLRLPERDWSQFGIEDLW
jgi:hypothetical protein